MCVKEETLPSASWEAPTSPKLFSVTKEGLRFVLDIVGHQQTVHKNGQLQVWNMKKCFVLSLISQKQPT